MAKKNQLEERAENKKLYVLSKWKENKNNEEGHRCFSSIKNEGNQISSFSTDF